MRLKVVTTGLVVFGLVLMVMWVPIIGPKPVERDELAVWAVRLGVYFLVLVTTFVGAAIGAIVLSRRAREEYRAKSQENLRELIEGTLADHRSRKDQEP